MLIAVSLIAALFSTLKPPASGLVVALFPPWWGGTRSLLAAASSGAVVRFGGMPFVVFVEPISLERLHEAGAWLVVDSAAFGGCAERRSDPSQP